MVCKHLIPGQQEDAHEFLRYLMEAMEKAYLNRYPNSKQFDQYSKETTPINQILGGYLKTSVRCLSCSHVSVTFQHFEDLLLDIRKANTVEEALDLYFARERLEDMGYKCESCKKKVSATKQFSLERAPIALCIQLKRFSMAGNKINKHITIREHLNLSTYSSKKNGTANEHLSYRLVAMVTHLGASQHCGHYTAIGLTDAGGYYQFDDSCVRPISLQSVLNTNTYIIFYELETNTPSLSALSSSSWKAQASNENNKCEQRNGLSSVPKICPSTQTSGNKLVDTNQVAIKRKLDIGVKLNGAENSTESNTNSHSSMSSNYKQMENGDSDHNNIKMTNGASSFFNVKKRNENLITIKINNTSNTSNDPTNNCNAPAKLQSYNNLTNGHQTARLPSLPTLTDDTDDYQFEVKANGSYNSRSTNSHNETENHNSNSRTSTVAAGYKSNLHGTTTPEKQTKSLVPYTSDEDEEDDDDDNDVDNFNDSGNNSPNETVKTTRSGPFQVTTTLPITKQNDASASPTVQINHSTNSVAFKRNDLICNSSDTTNRESNNLDDTPKMPAKAKSTNVILKRPYQASKDGQELDETAKKLLKYNHRGYGVNVLSWNGNRSCIDKEVSVLISFGYIVFFYFK